MSYIAVSPAGITTSAPPGSNRCTAPASTVWVTKMLAIWVRSASAVAVTGPYRFYDWDRAGRALLRAYDVSSNSFSLNQATMVIERAPDVEAGRLTEVDFMNGAIVKWGEQAGVPTPLNRALWELVKGLEHSWTDPD